MEWILGQIQSNQFLVAGLFAIVSLSLRSLPTKLAAFVFSRSTYNLTLYNTDQIYNDVDLVLSRSTALSGVRRLNMVEGYQSERGEWDWEYTLGSGWHLRWYKRAPMLVLKTIKDRGDVESPRGLARPATLSITTLGASRATLDDLIRSARTINKDDGYQRVFYWSRGSFVVADRKRKRGLNTVFVDPLVKARLLSDMEDFLASRSEYHRRGDPYRRTYGLEGPPGTGKTTLVQTLAAHFDRDVYVVSLSSADNDEVLQMALNQIDRDAVGLIEDIDTNQVARQRRDFVQDGPPSSWPIVGKHGLTLSGLLNALDGATAREGRIMFVTSNHLGTLDEALTRPGRIDTIEHVGLIGAEQALQMSCHYWPTDRSVYDWYLANVEPILPIVPSRLREMLLARHRQSDDASTAALFRSRKHDSALVTALAAN